MNTDTWENPKFTSVATYLPQYLGFENTVSIYLYDEIKQLAEDQNGMVTDLGSYLVLNSSIEFFSLHHIFECLRGFNIDPQLFEFLSDDIVHRCANLPQPFAAFFNVKVAREVRIMLPSVSVPSKAASSDVFQRLVEEQTVESVDLGKEEQTCLVCLEDLSESSSNNIIRMPKCLHLFHQDCIFEWLRHQNSCPLCRRVPYDQVHETE
ncbi:E3 ubiquitin-protein ligase ATL15 [Cardamine amara subsp. amara]|uniref:E3 ubiquitin-protein ligase ATL15 n=1 Tax=Cardamine amara subsp. amara TaxID=228776 RepID=A0ABD1C691_CARAN